VDAFSFILFAPVVSGRERFEMRTRFQFGSVVLEKRKRGPAVWVYRYNTDDGVRKKVQIGTVERYPLRVDALRASEGLRLGANPECPAAQAVKVRAAIHQYSHDELPSLRKSTATHNKSWIVNYIEPKWGDHTLQQLAKKPFAIEQWLANLPLSPKSKAHIRSIMRVIFACAMRWGFVEAQLNPLSQVRVKGCTKRKKQPCALSAPQLMKIAERIPEPFKTMVLIAICLGLRVSEVLGLQWRDVDWDHLLLTVERAYVLGQVDDVKTIYSERRMPLDPALGEILLAHKRIFAPDAEGSVWIFSNPDTGRPWWPHQIQQHHIRKAGMEVLNLDHIGWHTFRHSYSSLLRELGVDVKVQQELLRHADIRTTMNLYTQAVPSHLREANASVVRLVLNRVA
jgi:integrase